MMMLATDIYPVFAAVYWMSWKTPEPDIKGAAWFEDRTIAEYAREIWDIRPEQVSRHSRRDLQ